jgi:hypothetical protein
MPDSALLRWDLRDDYGEVGGREAIREAIEDAYAQLPREHLRRLDAVLVTDRDPKGRALGVWRQDADGLAIELYAQPHAEDVLRAPRAARAYALRFSLAHTLFHEVGHHVTRVLNRRATPPRKPGRVDSAIEKWAEEYAVKRLQRLLDSWSASAGPAHAPEERAKLLAAVEFLSRGGPFRFAVSAEALSAASPDG